jgi:hypothetical protein
MPSIKIHFKDDTISFLNVDLDIYSRSRLDALAAAFGNKMVVLFVGRELHRYSAHLEVAGNTKSADATIQRICKLVRGLPRASRKLWDAAITRDFNIGIQAASRPRAFEFVLDARTVQKVASLNARIVVTVYAPEKRTKAR